MSGTPPAHGAPAAWYSLVLRAGADAWAVRQWQHAWAVAYGGRAGHPGNALFRRSAGRDTVLYFSPAAGELAQAFGARRCEPPPLDKLALVAGDPAAWQSRMPQLRRTPPAEAAARRAASASTYARTLPPAFLPTQPPG